MFSKPVAFRRQSLCRSFAQITILSYTWFPIRFASASLLHSSEWNSTCEWLEEARKQQYHCMLQDMRTFHLLLTSSLPSHLKMYSIIYISSASWIKGRWRHYFDRLRTQLWIDIPFPLDPVLQLKLHYRTTPAHASQPIPEHTRALLSYAMVYCHCV